MNLNKTSFWCFSVFPSLLLSLSCLLRVLSFFTSTQKDVSLLAHIHDGHPKPFHQQQREGRKIEGGESVSCGRYEASSEEVVSLFKSFSLLPDLVRVPYALPCDVGIPLIFRCKSAVTSKKCTAAILSGCDIFCPPATGSRLLGVFISTPLSPCLTSPSGVALIYK